MTRPSRWPQVIVVAGLFVLSVIFIVGHWDAARDGDDPLGEVRSPSRVFTGVISGPVGNVAGARLTLREGVEAVAGAVSGPDGAYEIEWKPRTTTDHDKLRLLVEHEDYAATIGLPAERFELADAVSVEGIVLAPDGAPWEGARVEIASLGYSYGTAVSPADGTFALDGVARDAELDVYVEGADVAPFVQRGFLGGQRIVLHAGRGKEVAVRLHDPAGRPVEGASLRFAAPDGFSPAPVAGSLVRLVAASTSSAYVVARAPGHLPVYLDAPVFGVTEAVLWPEREVTLRLWDAVRRRGVFGVEVEVNLARDGANVQWNGPDAGRSHREFPLRIGDRKGEYALRLPRAPVSLRLASPGYADRVVELGAEATVKTVRMRPLREAPSATLRVACDEPIWLVVADKAEPWYSAFRAPGEVTVPAGRPLELASGGAANGVWLPPVPVPAIARGRVRQMHAPLRPAAELIIETDPPTPCEIVLVDPKFGRAVPPVRVSSPGRASVWVRPNRDVSVSVTPRGNWQPVSDTFAVAPPKRLWTVHLLEAAGLRMRVRDPAGHPVSFAEVRYWEAALAGRLDLRSLPSEARADAFGLVELLGLRRGPTPFEVAAPGFRTARPRVPELSDGRVFDGGELVLRPAGVIRGTVVDENAAPMPGVYLYTLARDLRRLALPGGGERDVYDLTDEREGDAISDARGRFSVRDAAPRMPMLVASARGNRRYAVAAVRPGGEPVIRMPRAANVALPVRGRVEGIYLLLPGTAAVRVFSPGPLRMNPVPLTLPAGRVEILIDYRYRDDEAAAFDLEPGDQRIEMPR